MNNISKISSEIINQYCKNCGSKMETEGKVIENDTLYVWMYCPNKLCEISRLVKIKLKKQDLTERG